MQIESTERRYIVTPETEEEYTILDFLLHACAQFAKKQQQEKDAEDFAQFSKIVDSVYQQPLQAE
jgi:NRPS condensation-like uncharacterized protein